MEEIRLGSVDDPELGFSNIAGVTVDVDGNAYVLDRQEREVRVFSPSGARLRVIGGEGEGPGEFGNPSLIGFKDDTLWVNDTRLRRITMFSRDGEVLASFPAGRLEGGLLEFAAGVLNLGSSAGALRADGLLDLGQPGLAFRPDVPPPDSVIIPIVRFDRSGAVVDTVDQEPYYFPPFRRIGVGGEQVWVPDAPQDTPLRVRLENGLILIDRYAASSPDDAVFTVTRTGESGDTLYHRRFAYEPKRISAAYVDSLITARVESTVENGEISAGAVESALRGAIDMPPFLTPISRARAGEDGTLWLEREVEMSPTTRWLILQPDGAPRGQVVLPRNAVIRWTGPTAIYVVEEDEFEVPWLVRYRLEPSG